MLDRIASEQLLKQLGEASSTMLMVKDLEHRFLYANDAFVAHLEVPLPDIVGRDDLQIGRSPELVLGHDESGWPGLWALDNSAIALGKPSETIDAVNEFGNHNVQKLVLRLPLITNDGSVTALMVLVRDVTEEQVFKQQFSNNLHMLNALDADITTLDTVMEALLACRDITSLANLMIENALERTRADGAYLCVKSESTGLLDCIARKDLFGNKDTQHYISQHHGICGKAWREGKPIYVKDANAAGSYHLFTQATQMCVFPILIDQKTQGLLFVSTSKANVDLESYLPILERLVGFCSIALANLRLTSSTERSLSNMQALAVITKELLTIDEPGKACDTVCRLLLSNIDLEYSGSYLRNDNKELAIKVNWLKKDARPEPTDCDEVIEVGISKWVFENGQMAIISRLARDPRVSNDIHDLREKNHIGCTVCMPIFVRGAVIGTLLVARDRSHSDLNEEEIGFLLTIVNLLSSALERMHLTNELHHQAHHDSLTDLANRRSLEKNLLQAITNSSQLDTTCAVLFLDLNGFKSVNDSFGHAVGDKLLFLVAERFKNCLQSCDLLARLGGDEFAIILSNIADADYAYAVGNRLINALTEPFRIDSIRITVGASIGISCFPRDGISVDELLSHADMAMYQAKLDDNNILCFSEELAAHSRFRAQIEHDLREALIKDEFKLLYQPLICSRENGVYGAEALIRWQHPQHGLMLPSEFIPVAESAGLIDAIGAWVVNEASRQLSEWQNGPLSKLKVSVNISASQFQRNDFVEEIILTLNHHGACASNLMLELTESVVMRDIGSVAKRLKVLRDMGVRIAIDDFGTGYSSLSYLQDLPVDVLKIDQSFVSRLPDTVDDQSLVKSIQLLASGLGLTTVAEGVETASQLDAVKRMGCNAIQGYFYSKPLPANELSSVVERFTKTSEPILESIVD